ncbi:GAF domain-containing protein [bacterium]|nr:GAF domain-containing protein [bacterium]
MKLIIVKGPNKGTRFDVDDTTCTIGRAHSNRVVLYDPHVSARHAVIEAVTRGYAIRDLGSSNGTFVNGLLAAGTRLMAGDTLQVGDTVLAFQQVPVDISRTAPFSVDRADESTTSIHATLRREDASLFRGKAPSANVESLHEDRRKLLALYRVNNAISSVHETHELMCRVLEEIFDVLNAERGFVMLLDESTDELVPVAVRRRHADNRDARVAIGHDITRQVVEKGEAVLSTDTPRSSQTAQGGLSAAKARSVLCAPLHGREKLQGIIYLDNVASRARFTPRDLRLLTTMADQLGAAVENARLAEARIESERFAAIGQAVAGLSHYIKNILGCMQGGGQIVQRGLDGEDIDLSRRGWDIVRRNENRIAELVLDMLNYSGAGEPYLEPCQLNDIVIDVAESTGADQQKAVHVETELAEDLPSAQADPVAVHRCLLNLVSNAIDALPDEGGTVRFQTSLRPDEKSVCISVSDTGAGIAEDRVAGIFNVFVSTKGARGTGLGLAVVSKMMKEHGGSVEVESESGKGSSFTLVFPPPGAKPTQGKPTP